MQISTIHLANIRGFQNLTINCAPQAGERGSITLIIGQNGTGKTTLLRAIALALCDLPDANALIAEPIGGLVTNGSETGDVVLIQGGRANLRADVTDDYNLWGKRLGREIQISRNEETHQESVTQGILQTHTVFVSNLVCGYGVGRTGGGQADRVRGRQSYRIMDSVRSLFDYDYSMQSPELTLRRLRDFVGTEHFSDYLDAIKLSLGLSAHDTIRLEKGGGVTIEGETVGGSIPFEAWADGYRATFNWIIDLFGWSIQANMGASNDIQGTLLIDEVEQHLHPSLQVEVLPRLARLFPNMQIIATTHSPLVALGVKPESVTVLQRDHDGKIVVGPTPDFSGYSVEDILEDDRIFNTKKIYTLETSRKRAEYHQLVKQPDHLRSPTNTDRMRALAQELRAQQLPEFRQPVVDLELQRILQRHNQQ
ncbi:MAG: AAA family ATPase [Candidatus Promineifilaceae bacterium]